jgi:hypothetical protein
VKKATPILLVLPLAALVSGSGSRTIADPPGEGTATRVSSPGLPATKVLRVVRTNNGAWEGKCFGDHCAVGYGPGAATAR